MEDRTVAYSPVVMRTPPAPVYPRVLPPEGYAVVGYRDGFDRAWAQIETAAGQFDKTEDALPVFHRDFPDEALRPARCLFMLSPDGTPAATASLWTGDKLGPMLPRVHWVATDPAHEHKGLCKALLTALMDLAVREFPGTPVFLTSQTTSWPAVRLYLRYGFEPVFTRPANWMGEWQPDEAWRIIRRKIDEYEESEYIKGRSVCTI